MVKATIKKKTYNLDSALIEKVRRLLDPKTATEAIHKVLQKTLEDQEI